jgi:hypothetical protein
MQGHPPVGLGVRPDDVCLPAPIPRPSAFARVRPSIMRSICGRPFIVTIGRIEAALHPTGVLLFAAVAVALDLAVLRHVAPHPPSMLVLLVLVVLVLTTLAHEAGHALTFRLQGARNISIALRGTGGSCTGVVEHDTALRVCVRALAGPCVAALWIALLLVVSSICSVPFAWRAATLVAVIFAAGVEVFNVLPVHPQSDGLVALYALAWSISGQEPKQFDVLYLWRPLALAAISLMGSIYGFMADLIPFNWTISIGVVMTVLLLCSLPLLTLAKRCLYHCANKVE